MSGKISDTIYKAALAGSPGLGDMLAYRAVNEATASLANPALGDTLAVRAIVSKAKEIEQLLEKAIDEEAAAAKKHLREVLYGEMDVDALAAGGSVGKPAARRAKRAASDKPAKLRAGQTEVLLYTPPEAGKKVAKGRKSRQAPTTPPKERKKRSASRDMTALVEHAIGLIQQKVDATGQRVWNGQDAQRMAGIDPHTATLVMRAMVAKGLAEKTGNGPATKYLKRWGESATEATLESSEPTRTIEPEDIENDSNLS